jgi:hypothetical protein
MGFEGSLVSPAFHDHEAIGTARLLQDGEFQIRGLAAARVAKFFDEFDALGHRGGPNVEIGHGMDGIGGGLGSCRGDDDDSSGDHKKWDHGPSAERNAWTPR